MAKSSNYYVPGRSGEWHPGVVKGSGVESWEEGMNIG